MKNINLSSIDNLALSLDQPQKGEKITLLSLDKVIPDPDQPRRDRNKEADNELANSIKEEGVIQPIIVRPENDDGYHMIICGERRYDGSKKAGLDTIPCIVRDIESSMILTIQTVENIQRDNMSLADEIEAVAKIAKAHGTKKTAELLGKKSQYVSKRVRVYKANPYLWDFIKLGYSNDFSAFYELALLDSKNHDEAKILVDSWILSPTIRTSLRTQVEDIKRRISKPKKNNVIDINSSNDVDAVKLNDDVIESINTIETVLNDSSDSTTANGKKEQNQPKKVKKDKPLNVGGVPDSFKVESLQDRKLLSFTFDDGVLIDIEISNDDWMNFVNEVNKEKV